VERGRLRRIFRSLGLAVLFGREVLIVGFLNDGLVVLAKNRVRRAESSLIHFLTLINLFILYELGLLLLQLEVSYWLLQPRRPTTLGLSPPQRRLLHFRRRQLIAHDFALRRQCRL